MDFKSFFAFSSFKRIEVRIKGADSHLLKVNFLIFQVFEFPLCKMLTVLKMLHYINSLNL